jgi:hypothetical protein
VIITLFVSGFIWMLRDLFKDIWDAFTKKGKHNG